MKKVSNKRLYVNPNSMEPIMLEQRLAEAGIEFMSHETGPTLGNAWETALPYAPQVVYTVFEEDFEAAEKILDDIRANASKADADSEYRSDWAVDD
ncbi:MAG: DUF2007 domain-containing protein [Bacteroidales bacterium]|nr:DUF2007 domain-containing protein [Bacteroidales bacterium]